MDQAGIRGLTSQLAEDLAWLENHARTLPQQAPKAGALRLAAALVRNVIGPFLEKQPPSPLHVAVVGGAGAGKSTVANFLCGAVHAESNPQAGFTRHPIAYASANGQTTWGAYLGFLGPLQRLVKETSASLDEDVYQVRKIKSQGSGGRGQEAGGREQEAGGRAQDLLDTYIVWDCPDMTTWAATGYVNRLLEVC